MVFISIVHTLTPEIKFVVTGLAPVTLGGKNTPGTIQANQSDTG